MILSNIKQFLEKNKKIFYYLGFFLVVFALSSDVTFAEIAEGPELNLAQKIATGVNALLSIVSLLLGLITYLATIFLSPEWINGSLFGMSAKFKEVWIMVSNIVYFIFAFILIWIAFMNIIGKGGDQYQLKQALPKFIVGVLIVPFSWFLVQFILSISAILTVSALTLPMDTFPDHKSALENIYVQSEIIFDLESTTAAGFVTQSGSKMTLSQVMSGGEATNAIFGIISMYTYGIIGIDKIDDIQFKIDSIKQIGDIAVKLIFDVLFVIVYLILIVALGLVLMIRGIYIWIYVMLSPIFGLMYFFDKKEGGGFFEKFNVKEFIALAMVPVYTMLALSFGLLFIYVVGTGMAGSTSDSILVKTDAKQSSISIGEVPNKVTLIMKGAIGSKSMQLSNFVEGAKATGDSVLGVVGQLILKLFGIVILWGSVLAALGASKITEAVIKPLQEFGGSVGKIVSSAPGNIPIFGGQSMKSMSSAASQVSSSIDSKQTTKAGNFLNKTGFLDNDKIPQLDKFKNNIKGFNKDIKRIIPEVQQIIKTSGDFDQIKSIKSAREGIFEALKGALTEADFKNIDIKSEADLSNTSNLLKALTKLDSVGEDKKIDLFPDVNHGGSLSAKDVTDYAKEGDISSKPTKATNEINLKITSLEKKLEGGLDDRDSKSIAVQLTNQGINGLYTEEDLRYKLKGEGITEKSDIDNVINHINKEIELKNSTKKSGDTKIVFFKEDNKEE